MDDKLLIRLKNEISEIAKISQIFNRFSTQHQFSKNISNAFDLALDEILNNIMTYGYDDQKIHDIDIQIHLSDNQLIVTIIDDGREFNPLNAPAAETGSSLEDRRIGGLGIHLIRKTMDNIYYKYENNKNCLTIKKNIRE